VILDFQEKLRAEPLWCPYYKPTQVDGKKIPGFDGDHDVRIARRGAHGHVKMGKPATANDNAVALAA
jgi:hypothetical protein